MPEIAEKVKYFHKNEAGELVPYEAEISKVGEDGTYSIIATLDEAGNKMEVDGVVATDAPEAGYVLPENKPASTASGESTGSEAGSGEQA